MSRPGPHGRRPAVRARGVADGPGRDEEDRLPPLRRAPLRVGKGRFFFTFLESFVISESTVLNSVSELIVWTEVIISRLEFSRREWTLAL